MVFALDPLRDPRWADLVARHPRGTVFHTTGWLDALRRTYAYEPVAFTTSHPDAPLSNGIVFCQVRSWITGSRLVSLPFSDYCDPLADSGEAISEVCRAAECARQKEGLRHVELRPRQADGLLSEFGQSAHYWLHQIDLQRPLDEIFRSFHRDSVQRKIRRGERERLVYADAPGVELLAPFYTLLCLTRQRHQLPPQPIEWFRNVLECLGPTATVRVASLQDRPVAAILTLRHRDVMLFKYGASDPAYHQLGGVQLLLWRAIQDACRSGCDVFDLGRTDLNQSGLVTFKDRWGAAKTKIAYVRSPAPRRSEPSRLRTTVTRQAQRMLGRAPQAVRAAAGRYLYRHAG